jgi:hypothetical protein
VRRTFDCDVDGHVDGLCTFIYCLPEQPHTGYLRCIHTRGCLVGHRRHLFGFVLRCVANERIR